MFKYHTLSIIMSEGGNIVTLNGHQIARSTLDIQGSKMFSWDVKGYDIVLALELGRVSYNQSETGGISSEDEVRPKKDNSEP